MTDIEGISTWMKYARNHHSRVLRNIKKRLLWHQRPKVNAFLKHKLAACKERVAPSRLEFQSRPGRHPDCARCCSGVEKTAEHAFYYSQRVRSFWDHVEEWMACIEPKQLVLHDVGYVVDNVLPPFQGEKRVVFLAILAVARMEIWTTRKKGLYDDANCSHRDLILFFRHQLRVKIRCEKNA